MKFLLLLDIRAVTMLAAGLTNVNFKNISVTVVIIFCAQLLSGCFPTILVDHNEKKMRAELERLTAHEPIAAKKRVVIEYSLVEKIGRGRVIDNGSFRVEYPAGSMVTDTGNAALNRWFSFAEGELLTLEISHVELEYMDSTDVGSSRIIINVRLRARLINAQNQLLQDEVYESGKQRGERFSSTFSSRQKYQDEITGVTYKAMFEVFEKVMAGIVPLVSNP